MLSNENRAKQFLPFDALTGFSDAIREKDREEEKENRKELSEEELEEISNILQIIDREDEVLINYYNGIRYERVKGKVKYIDNMKKSIIVNSNNTDYITIKFYNIDNIKIL